MTILLLFTAINTPYRISFVETDDITWDIVDILTDFTFAIDIIINFFSAYQDENEEIIHNRAVIAKKYLRGWFLIDLISIMPFSYMLETSDYASLAKIARLPKLYRLIKMAKLARILKVIKERNTISKYLNEVLKLSVGLERLSFFVLMFIVSVHITACFWVLIVDFEDDMPDTWINRANL